MTYDIDSRLEAALHRIAAAHVPEGLDGDTDESFTVTDQVAVRSSGGSAMANRRILVGVAAGVLVLVGIGALLVLGPRNDNTTGPAQSVPPEESSLADALLVTLGVTNTTATADEWSRLPDNELEARSEHLVVATDGGLFVWGGYAGRQVLADGALFDAATGQWRTLPPAPLAADRGDAIGVWTGSEVVVINGVSGNVKSAAFDPATFTWRALSDPPVDNAANGASRAVLMGDGDIMLFSVFEDGAAPQDQVAVLDDLQSGHWSVVNSPPIALASGVDLVAAGPDTVVVGRTTDPTRCGTLHVLSFTPTDNSWTEIPADPVARLADPVSVWTGTELFVGGGGSCVNGVAAADFENSAYLLDPTTGEWRTASPAPESFYSSYRYPDIWTGSAVATVTPNGQPLLYNPDADVWHLGPAIDANHAFAPNQTPMVLSDNSLVVSSGQLTRNGELCCGQFGGTYAYTALDNS